MAVTAVSDVRLEIPTLKPGSPIRLLKATASGGEDITWTFATPFAVAPDVLSVVVSSAAGGATAGVKSVSTTTLVVTTSAASTVNALIQGSL